MADQDQDGALDSEDILYVLDSFSIDLNELAAETFIEISDRNGDGQIDEEEYEDFVDFIKAV